MKFAGWEISVDQPLERPAVLDTLRNHPRPIMVLDTCQRLECYGLEQPELDERLVARSWAREDAFARLARIACGLESRILGELEVLGQVRQAYKSFHSDHGRQLAFLDRVFQDAISLARRARRESGIDRNLTSLSGLASRELISRTPQGAPVAVIGSGSIAGSVVRYLSKRGQSPIRVMSRCPERAVSLALSVGGFGSGLDRLAHKLDGVAGIISATAAPHQVLYARHLEHAARPLNIIDLGEPADCDEEVQGLPGVDYVGLLEIEERANVNTDERKQSARVAARIIRDGAHAWSRRN